MILFKILTFKDKVEELEKWVKDPGKNIREYAQDMIMGYVISYISAVVLVLGFLALLGFAPVLGGPYQPARILLYALLFVALLIGIILVFAWLKLKKLLAKVIESYRMKGVRDVDYEIQEEPKEIQ